MECKDDFRVRKDPERRDLIETLWNVKHLSATKLMKSPFDLIETLWNVKIFIAVTALRAGARFNRDIVECKARALPSIPADNMI